MADREAKKQRLRELRDQHDCVRTIVNHMGKHYKTVEPPPWLDLRLVAGQLKRSTRPQSHHAAWKYLRDSMASIQKWMGCHKSWKDAVKESRMPHIGTPSEIKATEFIHGKDARVPNCIIQSLRQVQLQFLLDTHPPSEDEVPDFWKGAQINDPEWRSQFMEKRCYVHNIPFDDDLTDLVLSTVCQKGQREDDQQSPVPAGAEGDNDGPEPSKDETPAKKGPAKDGCGKGSGDAEMWKDQVQATMSRIADTVNEALAAERMKLLGKRYRREDNAALAQSKRQKTAEPPSPPNVMDTIERSEDDRSAELPTARACVVKDDEQLRKQKAAHKKLRRDHDELATLCKKLDGSRKTLEEGVEHLTKQHKELRNEHNAGEQKHQQLSEKCDALESQTKALEVRCTALTDDVRTLEDKSAQTLAQCSALEDENKILRAQIVSLMDRVEALEQAQSTTKTRVEPQTFAPKNTSGSEPVETAARDRCRQPSIVEAASNDMVASAPRDDGQSAATPATPATLPPLQWEQARTAKYENVDSSTTNQLPQARYKPCGSRFPRVLEMPTFEPDWDPNEEVYSRRTKPPRLTCYTDTAHPIHGPAPSYPYVNPAARVPTPAPTPAPMSAPAQTPMGPHVHVPAPATAQATVPAPEPTFALAQSPTPMPVQTPTPTLTGALQSLRPDAPTTTNTSPFISANFTPQQSQAQTNQPIFPTPTKEASPPNPIPNPTAQPSTITTDTLESTIQAHLSWLPQAHRPQLLSILGNLDPRIWTSPSTTNEQIAAHCLARGLRPYDRLDELIGCFRKVLGELGVVIDGGGGVAGGHVAGGEFEGGRRRDEGGGGGGERVQDGEGGRLLGERKGSEGGAVQKRESV